MSSDQLAPRISPDAKRASTLLEPNSAFAATTLLRDAIDPVLTEIVRLRCAHVHDCRFCSSVRLVDALDAGMTEGVVSDIDDYENSDFDPRWKAALRLTDAVILAPGDIDDALRDEVRRHFTDTEISELLFDVMKWSSQKFSVALRLEAAQVEEGEVALFALDGSGNLVPASAISA